MESGKLVIAIAEVVVLTQQLVARVVTDTTRDDKSAKALAERTKLWAAICGKVAEIDRQLVPLTGGRFVQLPNETKENN